MYVFTTTNTTEKNDFPKKAKKIYCMCIGAIIRIGWEIQGRL